MGRMDHLIKREIVTEDDGLLPYNPFMLTVTEIPTFVIVDDVPPEPMSWVDLLRMFIHPDDLFQG